MQPIHQPTLCLGKETGLAVPPNYFQWGTSPLLWAPIPGRSNQDGNSPCSVWGPLKGGKSQPENCSGSTGVFGRQPVRDVDCRPLKGC